MSAREGLAAALMAHTGIGLTTYRGTVTATCDCDANLGAKAVDAGIWVPEAHRAHLAEVILRDWLPGALADERVVEAAARAINRKDDEVLAETNFDRIGGTYVESATAALTAAVTALREEPEHG